jgi:hypothetical protein
MTDLARTGVAFSSRWIIISVYSKEAQAVL